MFSGISLVLVFVCVHAQDASIPNPQCDLQDTLQTNPFVDTAHFDVDLLADDASSDANALLQVSVQAKRASANSTLKKKAGKARLDLPGMVWVEDVPVLRGADVIDQCTDFADSIVNDLQRPAVKVCGTGIRLTAYLLGRCAERLGEDSLIPDHHAVEKATHLCPEHLDGRGAGYRGCQTHSRSGRLCQKWTSQSPHRHTRTPSNYGHSGLGDHNFCRNPDGARTIWCYTQTGRRWEYCEATPPPLRLAPQWEVGACDSSLDADTCEEFSPDDDARFGAVQSYKIEQC